MGRYASRDLKPLRQVAIIDEETLSFIASQVEATDISGKVDKVTGKSLVSDTEIAKIHSAGSDNQDLSGKEDANVNIQAHVTATHAPANAQKNSDITKQEIEAKLTGELTSHTHAGGSGGMTQSQILTRQL